MFSHPANNTITIIRYIDNTNGEVIDSVFRKSDKNLQDILNLFGNGEGKFPYHLFANNRIPSSVFGKDADDVKKILELFHGEEPVFDMFKIFVQDTIPGSIFIRPHKEIVEIVNFCCERGIKIVDSMFRQPPNKVECIIEICQ